MKPVIYGISNHTSYSLITIEKMSGILKWMDTVLKAAKLPEGDYYNEKAFAEWERTKTETHWSFYDDDEKDGLRIDFFIASKKYFLVIGGSTTKRKKLLEQMILHGKMAEYKEKKIKN